VCGEGILGIIQADSDSVKGMGSMAKEEINILDYIVVCISEFASRYQIGLKEAYIYLNQYKGLEFLKEFYDVEHTLSFDDAIDDLATICRKNGGLTY
jgi:hypothetical protein